MKLAAIRGWCRPALAALVVTGLAAIVGSGGGVGFPDPCYTCEGPLPPSVVVSPARITVQVGSPVTFSASVFGYALSRRYTLQWCKRTYGAAQCIPIAGATGDTYTLAGANLGDDGALVQASVVDANGSAQSGGVLAVTAAPAVSFSDGDFAASAWSVRAIVTPEHSGAAFSESRPVAGGHPDAFLSVTYQIPAAPGSVRLLHTSSAAVYDPAAQGAVYVIDFSVDCRKLSFTGVIAELLPMIEPGSRRYVPTALNGDARALCFDPDWRSLSVASVAAGEFMLVDGPACNAGEACPEFSRQGLPIRLGFAASASLQASQSTDPVVQGIDGWKATVWPR